MKHLLIFSFMLCMVIFQSTAQEITLKAIPYKMHFENTPLNFKVPGDDQIEITAPGKTDLFISPDGKYAINKSPRLLFRPDSDFIFTASIQPDFKSKWDAGVLLIYNDSSHFAKFCFEVDYRDQPRVVSVVCNGTADDCNSMAIQSKEVYYRIVGSSKEDTFSFYYSADGKSWFLIRTFRLLQTGHLMIGLSAQSPTGKACQVIFSNIRLQQQKPADFWQGN